MPGPATTGHGLPAVWRVPPWQAATLLLAVSALAAFDIYGHPSTGWLIMTAFLAFLLLCLGAAAARFLLVADEDGIWVRRLFHERMVPWDQFLDVELTTGRRASMTVQITRRNATPLPVPTSLLLPTLPTGIRRAEALAQGAATQLRQIADQQQRR